MEKYEVIEMEVLAFESTDVVTDESVPEFPPLPEIRE